MGCLFAFLFRLFDMTVGKGTESVARGLLLFLSEKKMENHEFPA